MIKELHASNREAIPNALNRLGLAGIEFIEYATTRPQALGRVLEAMGFRPVARHRSREVTLYRQGGMNLIVNAHPDDARVGAVGQGQVSLAAVAFRVTDAYQAHQRCVGLGAWSVPSHAQAMELHIPAIQGPGGSRFYFVDRWQEFSIYDVDFKPIAGVDQHPPAVAGMNYFGVVQYVGPGRANDWLAYFEEMFDFQTMAPEQRFGILPKGVLMKSPCGQFLWQLIEPDAWEDELDATERVERLERIGLGTTDVPAAVAALKAQGVEFVEASQLHPDDRGALTRRELESVSFELVHQNP